MGGAAEVTANVWLCNLTSNTRNPETPQGGFAIVQAIVCALNEGNQLVFDGAEKQMNLTLNKETCFKGFSGLPATMSATVTAANNPDFASSFDYGLKMVISGQTTVVGISDKNGVKSFKMNSPKTSNGKSLLSARYGSINTSTGELFYEYTDVRLHDACPSTENGECYNRHLLVAATVPVSNGQFTGGMPTRMNAAYTNMYKQGAVFTDASGTPLVVSDKLFKAGVNKATYKWDDAQEKADRLPYALLLADALLTPHEVWVSFEQSGTSLGKSLLVRRLLKIFEVDGEKKYVVVSFTLSDRKLWEGSTVFYADDSGAQTYFRAQRMGTLAYKRGAD